VQRRLGFLLDSATARRRALAHDLAPSPPAPRPPACVRRWQCLKIGTLGQLDATPPRWFPGDQKNYPLLDLLDNCSRVRTGTTLHYREYRLESTCKDQLFWPLNLFVCSEVCSLGGRG